MWCTLRPCLCIRSGPGMPAMIVFSVLVDGYCVGIPPFMKPTICSGCRGIMHVHAVVCIVCEEGRTTTPPIYTSCTRAQAHTNLREEADAALPSCLNPVPIRQLADAALPSCLNPFSISQLADAALPSLPLQICGKKQTRLCLVCLYKSAE